ncbi:hypothetical protein ACHRVW_20540 [Flavobacterium collinsii]|uniref:hypothetical protein n=3 Tax=Flavobacterium collinsii TaxID=1114861 RepID=UPI0037575713
MKLKKKIGIVLLSLPCFISCDKDRIEEGNETHLSNKITIENGRIAFPNKALFQDFYDNLKKENYNQMASYMEENFYKKNFYSLQPIVNDETEIREIQKHFAKAKQNQLTNKSTNSKTNLITDDAIIEHYDELDEIIGEDLFQGLLNENAEIQVGNTIYIYTNSGILFASKEYINEIYDFMKINGISSLGNIETIKVSKEYPSFNSSGGLKQVTPHISSFVETKKDDKTSETSFKKLTTMKSSETSTLSSLDNTINNLDICNPNSPLLANLFGETKVCITHYENRRRVKLKYYNVNLFLAYTIGVKVKHQFRGWTGIWREENTDEIALGVNSVTWFFDNSKVFNNTNTSLIVNYYIADTGKLYTSLNSYNNAIYVGTDKPIPNLPIKGLNIIIEVAANFIGKDLTEYEVRKLFYGSIYGQAEKIMKSLNKPMNEIGVIINQRGQSIVQYYNLGTRCTNCSDQQKSFDWGIITPKIVYNFGAGNGGDLNVKTGFSDLKFDFKNPKITGINIYGMAKKNGKWHGSKMVF